ncbi:hypothetical protein M2447_000862 [Ereboglobus sp. PH5-10]|nr:hypothetical protein [Ereboglobus sp. PH5-10]
MLGLQINTNNSLNYPVKTHAANENQQTSTLPPFKIPRLPLKKIHAFE